MAVKLDPEGNETKALLHFADDINGKNVLEVGCGDGRLTWQYASMTRNVTGIDPDTNRITRALASIPADFSNKVFLYPLSLVDYYNQIKESPGVSDHHLVLLSWAL